jgi:hypothetical protein
VLAGSSGSALAPVTTAPKSGFAIAVPGSSRVFRVQALNAGGKVIGSSATFAIAGHASSVIRHTARRK